MTAFTQQIPAENMVNELFTLVIEGSAGDRTTLAFRHSAPS
ncbi:hypothetical protein ACQR18_15450 [Bradyrhizobium oligotrophicum]